MDLQNQTVSPVGLGSSTINPDRIPPDQLFVVNITEVSCLLQPGLVMIARR